MEQTTIHLCCLKFENGNDGAQKQDENRVQSLKILVEKLKKQKLINAEKETANDNEREPQGATATLNGAAEGSLLEILNAQDAVKN